MCRPQEAASRGRNLEWGLGTPGVGGSHWQSGNSWQSHVILVSGNPGGTRLWGIRCPVLCESRGEATLPPTAWRLLVLGKLPMPPPPKGGRPQTRETASRLGMNGIKGFGDHQKGRMPSAWWGGTPGQGPENGKGRKYLDEGLSYTRSVLLSSPTSLNRHLYPHIPEKWQS